MRQLRRLCEAARGISPEAKVIFRGVPSEEDGWVARVMVADVILVESAVGPIEKVVPETVRKLQSLSQRVLAAAQDPGPDTPKPGA